MRGLWAYGEAVAVTEERLRAWWAGLDESQRNYMLNVWQGRPMPTEARALLDGLPGLTRIRGSFGGVAFDEYMPHPVKAFIRDRRDEEGWQPGG